MCLAQPARKTKNELFAALISKQPRRCNLKVLTEAAPRGGHRTLIALRESATAKNEKRKTKNEKKTGSAGVPPASLL